MSDALVVLLDLLDEFSDFEDPSAFELLWLALLKIYPELEGEL